MHASLSLYIYIHTHTNICFYIISIPIFTSIFVSIPIHTHTHAYEWTCRANIYVHRMQGGVDQEEEEGFVLGLLCMGCIRERWLDCGNFALGWFA